MVVGTGHARNSVWVEDNKETPASAGLAARPDKLAVEMGLEAPRTRERINEWVDEDKEALVLTEPTAPPDKIDWCCFLGPEVRFCAPSCDDVWVEKVVAFC